MTGAASGHLEAQDDNSAGVDGDTTEDEAR